MPEKSNCLSMQESRWYHSHRGSTSPLQVIPITARVQVYRIPKGQHSWNWHQNQEKDRRIWQEASQSECVSIHWEKGTKSRYDIIDLDTSFEELYGKHKNFKDGVLYLYFANVDGFWFIHQLLYQNQYIYAEGRKENEQVVLYCIAGY